MRVALVDDVELVVHGLVKMVEPYASRVEVVALPRDHAEDQEVGYDIVLVDGCDLAELATLRRRSLARRVVLWSWDTDPRHVQEAMGNGAAGYLAKTLGAADLVEALERIHLGETVVVPPPPVLAADPDRWPGRDAGLTARESEIIMMITSGLSNQQIADRAFLSINSVKSYIRSSYRKMGVTSRSRAVLWGIEHDFRRD
ncbi:LuxR C-terminal-related transcriptional regulator [Nocardioides mangrovicus]|uniref:LuxR C-terminal-related transcriptional regulator n=1 Tax=Nocardioides mangrovicus TaxID=2478913 RepID=UPI001E47E948|nr:response regulator transcription factor [Nocardioides mangrovicus]